MRVKSIKLTDFRNYHSAAVTFHPHMNIICGNNAQGKTNLLEAVSLFSATKNFRAHREKELLFFGSDYALLEGEIESRNRNYVVEIALTDHSRRQIAINGVKKKNSVHLGEILNTVLFCPEDLNLIRAGASARRSYLDDTIAQLRPRYAEALERYQKAWQSKSAILRMQEERPDLSETLDEFSLQMCRSGALITHYRAHFIRRLEEVAAKIHGKFSDDRESLQLSYLPTSTVTDSLASTEIIFSQLLQHQKDHREAELASQKCLTGPHLDDFIVMINGRSARQYASQGQTRTAVLSLKLAQRDIMYDDCGEYPVMLLDDVLSELDSHRQEFVLNHIKEGQVLLTCCEEEQLISLNEGSIFLVKNGIIQERL